eukprot:5886550-Pleurochrysis_carterae.AAC.4
MPLSPPPPPPPPAYSPKLETFHGRSSKSVHRQAVLRERSALFSVATIWRGTQKAPIAVLCYSELHVVQTASRARAPRAILSLAAIYGVVINAILASCALTTLSIIYKSNGTVLCMER